MLTRLDQLVLALKALLLKCSLVGLLKLIKKKVVLLEIDLDLSEPIA